MFSFEAGGQKELRNLFWADEDTDLAKAYIKTYKTNIDELQEKYDNEDVQSTYESHMQERRRLNTKLKDVEKSFDQESKKSESTQDESSAPKKESLEGAQEFWDEGPQMNNFTSNDDLLSINSFNSSLNFAKLQNSINYSRASVVTSQN